MPITHATMAVGWLAICGFPLLSGFFSKDEILYQTFTTNAFANPVFGKIFWGIGALTAILTAVYMTRLMVLTFWTKERWHDDHGHDHGHDDHADDGHGHHGLAKGETPHESPWSMTLPLIVLAIAAAVGGYVGVPNGLGHLVGIENSNMVEHFLEPSVAHVGSHGAAAGHGAEAAAPVAHDATLELGLTAFSILLALGGIAVGFWIFRKNPLLKLPKILEEKWRVDELYEATIIHPIRKLSESILWKAVDVRSIDGLVNAVADGIRGLGGTMRYLQSGLTRSYVAVILLGAACLVGYFLVQGYVK